MKIIKKFEEDSLEVEVRTIKLKHVTGIMELIVRVLGLNTIADAASKLETLEFKTIFENKDTLMAIVNGSVKVTDADSKVVSVEELDMDQIISLFPTILEVNQCFLQPLMGELAQRGVVSN